MFDMSNMANMTDSVFGSLCRKIKNGECALSFSGKIGIRTKSGVYKAYDVKSKTLTNITSFCVEASNFFFVMPTATVDIGDIILEHDQPKCVIGFGDGTIKVLDYETNEIKEFCPMRHIFLGNVVYFGKIVSLFGQFTSKNSMSKFIKNMCMMQMLSNGNMFGSSNGSASNANNGMSNMMQMMMMSNMFGGMGGMFGGDNDNFCEMFNLDFAGADETAFDAKTNAERLKKHKKDPWRKAEPDEDKVETKEDAKGDA